MLVASRGILTPYIPVFLPGAGTFDGTNDYMSRGGSLTGDADGHLGAVSFWGKRAATGLARVVSHGDAAVETVFDASDCLHIYGNVAGVGEKLNVVSTITIGADSTWHHFAVGWNLTTGASSLYIDGVGRKGAATLISTDISYNRSDHFVGMRSIGTNKFNGDLAELMVWREYIDWSNAANLAKVFAGGKAVDPGADGSLVTGTAPIMYHSIRPGDAVTAFATNRGSGGNFSISGTLVLAAGPNG